MIRLTYPTARRLLKEAVKENPVKVALPHYTRHGKPECIVGTVLSKAGVPIEQLQELDSYEDCSLEVIYDDDALPVELTDKAYSLLWRAQQEQDSGTAWKYILEVI